MTMLFSLIRNMLIFIILISIVTICGDFSSVYAAGSSTNPAQTERDGTQLSSKQISNLYPEWQVIQQETILLNDTYYTLIGIGKKTPDGYGKMKIVIVKNVGGTAPLQRIWSSTEYGADAPIDVPNYIGKFLILNPEDQQKALLVFDRIHSGSSGSKDIHVIEINQDGQGKVLWEGAAYDLVKKDSQIVVHILGEKHFSLENNQVRMKNIPRSEAGPADAVKTGFIIGQDGMILPVNNKDIYVTVGQTLSFIPGDTETKKLFDKGSINIYTNLWNDGHHKVTTSNANLVRYGNTFEFPKEGNYQFILEYLNEQHPNGTLVTFVVHVKKENKESANMSVHSFKAKLSNGEEIGLDAYKGKVMLIVNTASKCGLTPQYEGLEKLYDTYKDKGFTVLGFPCNQFGGQEPGTNEEISSFCSLNYQVEFPIFQKIDVNGENAHPLYQYLRKEAPEDENLDKNSGLYKHLSTNAPELLEGSNIKWNFTKFLIDKDGSVVKRYAPTITPDEIQNDIEKLLTK